MSIGVALPTAPAQSRRLVRRALTVAGVAAGAWLAFSLAGTANAQTPTDDIPSALQGVSESVGHTLGDTVDAAQPVTQAAVQIIDPVVVAVVPVVEQAAESVAPVAQAAGPVVEQAVDVAAPIAPSATEAAAPVLEEVAVISAPILDSVAPVVEEVAAPIAEGVAPIVDAAMPVVAITAPVVDAVTPVAEATAPAVAPIIGVGAPVVEAAASLAPVAASPIAVPAPSSVIVQDVPLPAIDVAAIADFTVGSPTAGSTGAGHALLSNVFTSGASPRTERDSASGTTPGSAPLLAPGAPIGGLPEPWAPPAPGAPGPAGAPGCPGQSGSGSGGSGSLHVAATTPFGPQRVQTFAQPADGDHAAALLTRCDEPGSSPD